MGDEGFEETGAEDEHAAAVRKQIQASPGQQKNGGGHRTAPVVLTVRGVPGVWGGSAGDPSLKALSQSRSC
jgi:hypothetical protein